MTSRIAKLLTVPFVLFGILVALASPSVAQDYAGSNTNDGVFNTPSGLAKPGSTISFVATGLQPNAVVTINLVDGGGNVVPDTGNDLSIQVNADATGRVETSITIPANLVAGAYTLRVNSTKADGSSFVSELIVVATGAAAPAAGNAPPALALTGSAVTNLLISAFLLMVLGAGLMLANRNN